LNNPFQGQRGIYYPESLLSRSDFFKALNESLTSLYLIGTTEASLRRFLTPIIGNENNEYASLRSFFEDMSYHEDNDIAYMGYKLQGDYVLDYDLIRTEPNRERDVIRSAESVSDRLHRMYPHKNFVVLYNYGSSGSVSFANDAQLQPGDLLVKRIGGVGVGNVVSLDVRPEVMETDSFIHSTRNVLSLFLSMRFEQKLDYLERLLTGSYKDEEDPSEDGELFESELSLAQPYDFLSGPPQTEDAKYMMALTDAMLADLAHEHAIVRNQSRVMDDDFDLEYEIYNLRKLTQMRINMNLQDEIPLTPGTLAGQMLVRLSSGMRYMAKTHKTNEGFVNRNFGWLTGDSIDRRPYRFTNSILDRFEMVAMGQVAPPRLSSWLAGKIEDPENEGVWVFPEDVCSSSVRSQEWYQETCVNPGTVTEYAFRNKANWQMDTRNKMYSELNGAEREIYQTGDYEESDRQRLLYERFTDQITLRTQLMLEVAHRNDGCQTFWCKFFRTGSKEEALRGFLTDPGSDPGRAELDNVVTGDRVQPVGEAIEADRDGRADERAAEVYQQERVDESELVHGEGGSESER
jgi:hypothetical protein